MRQLLFLTFVTAVSIPSQFGHAQTISQEGGEWSNATPTQPCLTDQQRQQIQFEIDQNIRRLQAEGLVPEDSLRPEATHSFIWPLRKAAGFNFNSYYGISNFVDQLPGAGLLDYDCGTRTYEGHKGLDIFTWPFSWYMVENDLVEIVAADAGIIVHKHDGEDDDHCTFTGNWNAVYVQHADGSVAWYGHMKKGSTTSKSIGQTVAQGEYLGVVASSGFSTGPHLHLEVYDAGNNLVDPYQGACNSLNPQSWWINQKPNREPTLNALLTHDKKPRFGCPGLYEEPHLADTFAPGDSVYFGHYYHDQTQGDTSYLSVLRPDNTVFTSWITIAPNTWNASWWRGDEKLPANAPCGAWTFQVRYRGTVHQHTFYVVDNAYQTIAPQNCVSYTSPSGNHTWTTSGNYKDTILRANGCDSILTINLTILQPTASQHAMTVCDSAIWRGKTFHTTGTYYDTIPNQAGCDSILTLSLVTNSSFESTQTMTQCDSVSWRGQWYTASGIYYDSLTSSKGCDSVYIGDLTVGYTTGDSSTAVACETYYWRGNDLTSSGIYFDTISPAGLCDTIAMLDLTIETVDTSVTLAGGTLTSSEAGADYQWLDCNQNYDVIPGATSQSFTPGYGGSFAVEIAKGACLDTSACHGLASGFGTLMNGVEFAVFPNPTNGAFQLEANTSLHNVRLVIRDVSGRQVWNRQFSSGRVFDLELEAAPGIYFLSIAADEIWTTGLRLVKHKD